MNFNDLVISRYSVRSYSDKPVDEPILSKILEAGRAAPTACNNQPQRIYVVKTLRAMEALCSVRSVFGAPVALVIGYDTEQAWHNRRMSGKDSGDVDTAIVCTHMMLSAWESGVGSCWIGSFNSDDVAAALGIPSGVTVTAILSLGYPAEDSEPYAFHFEKKPLSDTVSFL